MIESVRRRFDHLINVVELTVLILIGLATAFAMAQETWKVMRAGTVSLTTFNLADVMTGRESELYERSTSQLGG